MKQVYRDILFDDFCAMFNPASMYEAFGENIVTAIGGADAKLKGRDLLIDNPAADRFISEVDQDDDYQVRLFPGETTFATDTIIGKDTVALFSYDIDNTIVRIENKNVADSFRAWFEILWAQGEESPKVCR